ncbi:rhodanese-like domain-containing protein [Methylopila musalis]|uniref:Rhodanese-like domain-containing protein n=1 Tax=Methylopila musalis TaxID=1134781 RepID=A0ABW3Z6S8_9HYPH
MVSTALANAPSSTGLSSAVRSLGRRRKTVAPRRAPPLVVEARDAIAMNRRGEAKFIDLRDWEVLDRTGWISESLHCPPGEFAAIVDPASPLHNRLFEPGQTLVFYGGPKTAPLAAARKARALGLKALVLRGGFRAWRDAGGRIAGHPNSPMPVLKSSFRQAYRFTMAGVRKRLARLKRAVAG